MAADGLVLRPVGPQDGPALAAVAYHTAFFGESAAAFFPDAALFAALWTAPYLHAGFGGHVALRGAEVVGFILGAPDPGRYRAALLAQVARVLPTALARASGWASLPYLRRTVSWPAPTPMNMLFRPTCI
ncbi:hypothetical protein [Deinococcus multiflagellatus]|uniref:N-acetyltransferase domain-containing protein n=1 Tax=Deinococcus multiflagellatus TaxID=1656887 RepID=A0ABW1ZGV6_9DEIO